MPGRRGPNRGQSNSTGYPHHSRVQPIGQPRAEVQQSGLHPAIPAWKSYLPRGRRRSSLLPHPNDAASSRVSIYPSTAPKTTIAMTTKGDDRDDSLRARTSTTWEVTGWPGVSKVFSQVVCPGARLSLGQVRIRHRIAHWIRQPLGILVGTSEILLVFRGWCRLAYPGLAYPQLVSVD